METVTIRRLSEAELVEIEARAENFLNDGGSELASAIGQALIDSADYWPAVEAFDHQLERVLQDLVLLVNIERARRK